ncbi:MAG: hypothetical protein JSV79_09700 [Armatimonadota bacterium]|nr:MAG: hypothetical protein JSV79_09700 [Armatimonadota bacterium]
MRARSFAKLRMTDGRSKLLPYPTERAAATKVEGRGAGAERRGTGGAMASGCGEETGVSAGEQNLLPEVVEWRMGGPPSDGERCDAMAT